MAIKASLIHYLFSLHFRPSKSSRIRNNSVTISFKKYWVSLYEAIGGSRKYRPSDYQLSSDNGHLLSHACYKKHVQTLIISSTFHLPFIHVMTKNRSCSSLHSVSNSFPRKGKWVFSNVVPIRYNRRTYEERNFSSLRPLLHRYQ